MAYIPPHKRLISGLPPNTDTDTDTAAIAAPPPVSSPSSSPNHREWFQLDYSPFSIKRFLVISGSSNRPLEFAPFEDDRVFSHLEGSSLYAIKRDQIRAAHGEGIPEEHHQLDRDPNESAESCMVIHAEGKEFAAICHSIAEALRDDIASVAGKLKSIRLDPSIINCKVLLSVGRILFSSIDGRSFDWKQHRTPEYLTKQFKREGGKRKTLLKTFYDPQPSNLFGFFKEAAEKDNLRIRTKERYFILVEDKTKPGTSFYCVCSLVGDSAPTCQENAARLQRLEIRKVKRQIRLRHMVADVACIDKSHDLRIQLYSDDKSISVEERSDLESLLCNVVFVDGHPFLRYDDTCSSSGRFQFNHMFWRQTYSFKGATFKWILESVLARDYMKIKQARHYVRMKPILLQEYLQGRVECTVPDWLLSIEEALIQLWKCCS